MRYLTLLALLGCVVSALTACNTTRGVGEDVAATGRAVERAATPGYY
jgi:predicted small secreted protein